MGYPRSGLVFCFEIEVSEIHYAISAFALIGALIWRMPFQVGISSANSSKMLPLSVKGKFLQNEQVFEHSVVCDILHDLVYKADLPAVQIFHIAHLIQS